MCRSGTSQEGWALLLQPQFVRFIDTIMATDQSPEVFRVVGVNQMAQLMDHHIISNGMVRLDDIPVEDHVSRLVARPPA